MAMSGLLMTLHRRCIGKTLMSDRLLFIVQILMITILMKWLHFFRKHVCTCSAIHPRGVGRVLKVGRLWVWQWVEPNIIRLSGIVAVGNRKRSLVYYWMLLEWLCACSIACNKLVGVASICQKVGRPWPSRPPCFLRHCIQSNSKKAMGMARVISHVD